MAKSANELHARLQQLELLVNATTCAITLDAYAKLAGTIQREALSQLDFDPCSVRQWIDVVGAAECLGDKVAAKISANTSPSVVAPASELHPYFSQILAPYIDGPGSKVARS
jgi:hypothetical protein